MCPVASTGGWLRFGLAGGSSNQPDAFAYGCTAKPTQPMLDQRLTASVLEPVG